MAKVGVPGWQATEGLSPQPCHSTALGHGASPPHPYPKLGLQRHDTRQQQRPSAGWVTLRLLLRLVVTGVGVAVLTGTLLHLYRPATGNAVIFSCLPC